MYNDSWATLQGFKAMQQHVDLGKRNVREMKHFRKSVKCVQPLKVMIGPVNFFDGLSPITFVEFCIDQLVSLLLMEY